VLGNTRGAWWWDVALLAPTVTRPIGPSPAVAQQRRHLINLPIANALSFTLQAFVYVTQNPESGNWWDKSHPGPAPLSAAGAFQWSGGPGGAGSQNTWAWDPVGDATVPYFAVWILPLAADDPVVEGADFPASMRAAAVAHVTVDRRAAMGGGAGGDGGAGGQEPLPQPSASAAPSPAGVAEPSASPTGTNTDGGVRGNSGASSTAAGVASVAAVLFAAAVAHRADL
jgi:hypothetical protein